eukprot:TRINITY_DN875_c0_g1_i2.p1 TRINITY_DN875_c0_g1~~TRINITY_DN875_c0_g1_i2.p1  ORF type:complete len:407 (+),score=85.10 TRINITY_DN875_c0_g1_i2:127-1221(+)
MALKILQNAYRTLQREPVEGIYVEPHEDNFFLWNIWIEGPQGTPYESGIFQLEMEFPPEYPMLPPTLQFLSEFWHPNVYPNGRVCISILHHPGDDPFSGELAGERWLPSQTVTTIILSVLSMLNDPNFSSPANIDASVECQHRPDVYLSHLKAIVAASKTRVGPNVKIPHPESNPEERAEALSRMKRQEDVYIDDDFLNDDDDYGDYDFGSDSGDDFDYGLDYSEDEFNYSDDTPASADAESTKPKTSSATSRSDRKKKRKARDSKKDGKEDKEVDRKRKSSSKRKEGEKGGERSKRTKGTKNRSDRAPKETEGTKKKSSRSSPSDNSISKTSSKKSSSRSKSHRSSKSPSKSPSKSSKSSKVI